MNKITLKDDFKISPIVHGYWRLAEWNYTKQETLKLIEQTFDLGISTVDHADIYGNYTCEKLFGDAISLNKGLRKKMQIITKCGIKLLSKHFPDREVKHYDYSYSHIIESVENSLKNFGTDYIDLLLLHRSSPFCDPEEISKAFTDLKKSGKVLHFGVSNFNSIQFAMLQSYLDFSLVTNQVEISPYCLEHFDNGNVDFFIKEKIKPMAWSPLAGGRLFSPKTDKEIRLSMTLVEIEKEYGIHNIEQLIYAWIMSHPMKAIPIVGSGKIERIESAVKSIDIKLDLEIWHKIYVSSLGKELP